MPATTEFTRTFGAQSMTAQLRDVLVKRPAAAFGAAFDDPAHGYLHPVDLDAAQREHDALTAILADLGADARLETLVREGRRDDAVALAEVDVQAAELDALKPERA